LAAVCFTSHFCESQPFANDLLGEIRKDAECTEWATQPESVQRFEQIIKNFRKKVLQLLDLFSQKAAKESGKVFVNVIASFLKAVGSVLMFLMLACLFSHL